MVGDNNSWLQIVDVFVVWSFQMILVVVVDFLILRVVWVHIDSSIIIIFSLQILFMQEYHLKISRNKFIITVLMTIALICYFRFFLHFLKHFAKQRPTNVKNIAVPINMHLIFLWYLLPYIWLPSICLYQLFLFTYGCKYVGCPLN